MSNLVRQKIGKLECIDFTPKNYSKEKSKCMILLHGYGANCEDLASLVSMFKHLGWRLIFPNAPIELDMGPFMDSRAWFPISIQQISEKNEFGEPVGFENLKPEGIKKARELILDLIQKLDIPYDKLVLGGFSQGAMLSTEVALHIQQNLAALVLLSGTLINQSEWKEKILKHKGLKVFQSHGEQDAILPYRSALALHKLLKESECQVEFHSFRGGHEIPLEILSRFGRFLGQI